MFKFSHSLRCLILSSALLGAFPLLARADEPTAPTQPTTQPNLMPTPSQLQPPKPGPTLEPWPRGLSPYELRAAVDIPLLAIGATIWILFYVGLTNELQKPACDPCDPSKVNAFDRWAIQFHDSGAATASNVMFYALPAIYATIELADYGIKNPKGYFTDVAVLAETLAWSGTFDEIFRRAVRRPRPFLYVEGVYPDERESAESTFSFYSGHASAMFALAVMTSYTFHLRHPHSPWRYVIWTTMMGYATAQGLLRIFSGRHFPTDVIAGAVIGSALGVLFPALHRRKNLPPVVRTLSLAPSTGNGVTSFTVGGRF